MILFRCYACTKLVNYEKKHLVINEGYICWDCLWKQKQDKSLK